MDFVTNKTPNEMIKEGAFGGTYFRDISYGVNGRWYRKSWKDFNDLKGVNSKYYCSIYCDAKVNKYNVECGTSFRFWENKGWIKSIHPYGQLQW